VGGKFGNINFEVKCGNETQTSITGLNEPVSILSTFTV
jgi:hypothetical protein